MFGPDTAKLCVGTRLIVRCTCSIGLASVLDAANFCGARLRKSFAVVQAKAILQGLGIFVGPSFEDTAFRPPRFVLLARAFPGFREFGDYWARGYALEQMPDTQGLGLRAARPASESMQRLEFFLPLREYSLGT